MTQETERRACSCAARVTTLERIINSQQSVWRPIKTAPEGREIIVSCPYEGVGVVLWKEDKNNGRGGWQPSSFDTWHDENCAEPNPTHWMPLPPPPEQNEGEIADD